MLHFKGRFCDTLRLLFHFSDPASFIRVQVGVGRGLQSFWKYEAFDRCSKTIPLHLTQHFPPSYSTCLGFLPYHIAQYVWIFIVLRLYRWHFWFPYNQLLQGFLREYPYGLNELPKQNVYTQKLLCSLQLWHCIIMCQWQCRPFLCSSGVLAGKCESGECKVQNSMRRYPSLNNSVSNNFFHWVLQAHYIVFLLLDGVDYIVAYFDNRCDALSSLLISEVQELPTKADQTQAMGTRTQKPLDSRAPPTVSWSARQTLSRAR